jgi:HK97 family phage major capsid protein
MNRLQQLQAELNEHNTAVLDIERRYPDGIITSDEDMKSLSDLTETIESKSVEFASVSADAAKARGAYQVARAWEQSASNLSAPLPNSQGAPGAATQRPEYKSFGQLFVETPEYQERLANGTFNSPNYTPFQVEMKASLMGLLEQKAGALIHTGRTGFGPESDEPFPSTSRQAGFIPLLYDPLTFSALFRRTPITEEIIEFVREKTFTNEAAMISEASAVSGTSGTKPQSDFDFEVDSVTVKDLAHWMAVTNKMMRQSNLTSLIDERLGLGLDILVEYQIINGDGTGNNLDGLFAAGIQTRAKGSDSIVDAIHKSLTQVRVTGLDQPNFIAMNPVDFETVRLARENAATATQGGYLYGPPSISGPTTMWGIPVTMTTQLTAGTALVGNSRQAEILDRQRTGVTVGTINDLFIRNMKIMLTEMALAFAVYRPTSFCLVSGL